MVLVVGLGGGGGAKKDLAGTGRLLSSTLYVHNVPSLIKNDDNDDCDDVGEKAFCLMHFLVWRNPRQEGIWDESA